MIQQKEFGFNWDTLNMSPYEFFEASGIGGGWGLLITLSIALFFVVGFHVYLFHKVMNSDSNFW